MGFSTNFYLDNAVSDKAQKAIVNGANSEDKMRLKKALLEEQLQIFLYLRWKGKTLKVYVERKCSQKEWDKDKQRVNSLVYKRGSTELNEYLGKIINSVHKLHESNLSAGRLTTKEELRKLIDEANLKDIKEEKIDLFSFIESFIEDSENKVKPATLSVYRTTLLHLRNFSKEKRVKVDFDTITLDFHKDFTNYFIKDLNFMNNTMGKYIRVLKNFLNSATELGINVSTQYKSSKFKAPVEETESIYLTEEEIDLLNKLDLSDNRKLDEVRDRFVAGCWLGVRFSDLSQLNGNSDIERRGNVEYIKLRTIKTDGFVYIPLHKVVKNIFNKYNGVLPKPISNQKMNEYIKDVGQLIPELAGKIVTSKTQGKERINSEPIEKYNLICTHTARRSFATNLFLQGVQSYTIMKITGHKTEKAFLRYIKVSSLQHAELLHKHYSSKQSLSN